MKRSAAIIGPTPPFLRWTIALPCPFRDPDSKSQNNAAFRDLRSLRAIAVAEIENRIVDGICLHPDSTSEDVADAKGFPIGEVYAAYGGQEQAANTCRSCPANVAISKDELSESVEHSKAGCFGWVPFGEMDISSPGFMRLMESSDSHQQNKSIVDLFESSFEVVCKTCPELLPELFPKSAPRWFGVWGSETFSRQQLELLSKICEGVDCDSIAWQRLVRAVRICCERPELTLHVDLAPAGFSDGKSWMIESACASCGVSSPDSPCKVCRSEVSPLRSRKSKVLGFRPYLNLVAIVGEEETRRLLHKRDL